MSVINDALSKLAEQQSQTLNKSDDQAIVRANVRNSKFKPSRLVWAVLGFTLSLGIGAWAVNGDGNQAYVAENSQPTSSYDNSGSYSGSATQGTASVDASSNTSITSRVAEPTSTPIYTNTQPVKKPVSSSSNRNQNVRTAQTSTAPARTRAAPQAKREEPGTISVQEVQLSNYQLAEKSILLAEKALEANNLQAATSAYEKALRYTSSDENTRRKLSALYYGNSQVRKSAETLEAGLKLNQNSTELRLALADILMKESQPEAALSVLGHTPPNAPTKYLAIRAGLAQKLKQDELAYQSYTTLIQKEPENARWWMGLAIQQERYSQYTAARASYEKALTLVGLSSNSQNYIRGRLTFLDSLENGDNT